MRETDSHHRLRFQRATSCLLLHPALVEPEVVATSPNRIKSPVPVFCGFSSLKLACRAAARDSINQCPPTLRYGAAASLLLRRVRRLVGERGLASRHGGTRRLSICGVCYSRLTTRPKNSDMKTGASSWGRTGRVSLQKKSAGCCVEANGRSLRCRPGHDELMILI